jgi:hypothetical protein
MARLKTKTDFTARLKVELSDFGSLWFTKGCEDREDHMGWTKIARREHDRSGLRHASDCTDEEWVVVGYY